MKSTNAQKCSQKFSEIKVKIIIYLGYNIAISQEADNYFKAFSSFNSNLSFDMNKVINRFKINQEMSLVSCESCFLRVLFLASFGANNVVSLYMAECKNWDANKINFLHGSNMVAKKILLSIVQKFPCRSNTHRIKLTRKNRQNEKSFRRTRVNIQTLHYTIHTSLKVVRFC